MPVACTCPPCSCCNPSCRPALHRRLLLHHPHLPLVTAKIVAGVKHVSQHIPSADTTHDAVKGGTASGAGARDIAIAEAASAAAAPDISPKIIPQYKGFDCKRVRVELQRLHPRATIEMLREGEKQRGVRADRITVVVDAQGDVVAAPRVG